MGYLASEAIGGDFTDDQRAELDTLFRSLKAADNAILPFTDTETLFGALLTSTYEDGGH